MSHDGANFYELIVALSNTSIAGALVSRARFSSFLWTTALAPDVAFHGHSDQAVLCRSLIEFRQLGEKLLILKENYCIFLVFFLISFTV